MSKPKPVRRRAPRPSLEKPAPPAAPLGDEKSRLGFAVVGLGGGNGSVEAVQEILMTLPMAPGVAFILVEHRAAGSASDTAAALRARTALPVVEVTDGVPVRINHLYVLASGGNVTLANGLLRLPKKSRRPYHPIDDFFQSLATEQRQQAICIILSGAGSQGSTGAAAVRTVGGLCIAQDPDTAREAEMPRAMVESGQADLVLPPRDIFATCQRYAAHPYASGTDFLDRQIRADRHCFEQILALLGSRTRHVFTAYRHQTLLRRIERRMSLHQVTNPADYVRLMRQMPAEVSALADDLLIHVTGFFRDPEAWRALQVKVIAPLVAARPAHSALRAWVTACSSGEEAYTVAMLLVEAAEAAGKKFDIKIFATDTAERSLSQARAGVYPGGIEGDVGPKRIERFFTREGQSYRVKRELRQCVIFAPQDVLQDPPFSQLDLCTCRNFLIYLRPEMQLRALTLIHFGLRAEGVLMLGNSETTKGTEELFKVIDQRHRLFRRIGPKRHRAVQFPVPKQFFLHGAETPGRPAGPGLGLAQFARKLLAERFGPPAVVVDRQENVVHFHGATARYLEQPRTGASGDLKSLLREDLRATVRKAVQQALAQTSGRPVKLLVPPSEDHSRGVEIAITPFEAVAEPAYFLITFSEPSRRAHAGFSGPHGDNDLAPTQSELHSTIEEYEARSREMQGTQEEIISINEELQSTNEELETSKEELQSLNEELTTVNAQLQAKMSELEATTNDLRSLLSSTDIAVVFLDPKLRVRRYTPAMLDLVQLIPADVGRPFSDLALKFEDRSLLEDARTVLSRLSPLEAEVTSHSGRAYVRRALPYRTVDAQIEGVVITFIEITRLKLAEAALRASEERHRLILRGVPEYAILVLDQEGRFVNWSGSAERIFGYSQQEALGRNLELVYPPEEQVKVRRELPLEDGSPGGPEERWHQRKDGTRFWGSGSFSALIDENGRRYGYVKVLRDATARKKAEDIMRQGMADAQAANAAKDQFLANISHELRTPLSAALLWSRLLNTPVLPGEAQLREGLTAIEKSAREQQALIEDLMDSTRIVIGKLHLQTKKFELGPLLQTKLEPLRELAAEREITMESHVDNQIGTVRADPLRLSQVVGNLVSNAIKFTPPGGTINVRVERQGEWVELRVTDTGRGIGADFLPRIFERFSQAENEGIRTSSGLGIGLFITRQLVELHGGTITAASPGLAKGATFTVRLPLPAITPDRPSASPITNGRPSLRDATILLVEDVDESRRALTAVLTAAGAQVDAVDSAEAALKAFNRERPALILSDVGLGKVSGHELIAQIRSWETAQHAPTVPAVALTAYADETNRQHALKAGFQQVLTKPIEPEVLVNSLASLLHLN